MAEWQTVAGIAGTLTAILGLSGAWSFWMIRTFAQHLTERMDSNYRNLEERMDRNHRELTERMDRDYRHFEERMDSNHRDLTERMDRNHREMQAYLQGHAHADGSPPVFHQLPDAPAD